MITTDGMENASKEYSSDELKRMIRRQEEQYGWEFLFIGANIDAVETAAHFGIRQQNAVDYHADATGTAVVFENIAKAVSSMRSKGMVCESWSEEIRADYKKRK